MTHDPTEATRRAMIENDVPELRAAMASALEEPTWDAEALRAEFEVAGFLAPYVLVRRRSDGKRGTMMFTHTPRLYFNWKEDPDGTR